MRNLVLILCLSLTAVATPALAQSDGWSGGRHDHGPSSGGPDGFRHGPPHGYRPPPGPPPRFEGRGYRPGPDAWRGGSWRHDWHNGRLGWWWNVGPSWYAFNGPVYPYPAYAPPVLEVAPPPPQIIVQAPPPAPGPAPTQFWYYCQQPQGYYPYVSACGGNWQEVPATPTR